MCRKRRRWCRRAAVGRERVAHVVQVRAAHPGAHARAEVRIRAQGRDAVGARGDQVHIAAVHVAVQAGDGDPDRPVRRGLHAARIPALSGRAFAAPSTGRRRAVEGRIALGDHCLARPGGQHDFRHLGAADVVPVLRHRNGRQHRGDAHGDDQFDDGEAGLLPRTAAHGDDPPTKHQAIGMPPRQP